MSDPTPQSVDALLANVTDERRRSDAVALLEIIATATGEDPKVWGDNTIGFGQYNYRYKTGQEGDFFSVGMSPRKDRLTLYIMSGLVGFEDILNRLGPHTSSKSAVHIKRLGDIDHDALVELIRECVAHIATVEESMGAIPRMSDIPPRTPS